MPNTKIIAASLLSVFAAPAFAHPGHMPDHSLITELSHWLTEPDHLLLLGAGIVISLQIARLLIRKRQIKN